MTKIIEDFKPNCIIYPDAEDAHPDHWAANAFVQYVLIKNIETEEVTKYCRIYQNDPLWDFIV